MYPSEIPLKSQSNPSENIDFLVVSVKKMTPGRTGRSYLKVTKNSRREKKNSQIFLFLDSGRELKRYNSLFFI
jgi:arginine/lysine/ornithine decarboxylase